MSNELTPLPQPGTNIELSTIYDKTGITAPEYKKMLSHIETHLPAIQRDSKNFYKSHSQFMGVTLDVTAITPVRRVKHVLAEIDRTRAALEEAYTTLRLEAVGRETTATEIKIDAGGMAELGIRLVQRSG